MASGTITGTTNNDNIVCKIVWSSFIQDIDHNVSSVTATLYYKRLNNYTTYGTGSFTLTIGDSTKTENPYIKIKYGEWVEAISLTTDVYHNSDGTISVDITGEGGISGTTLSSTDCSDTVTLDTIPRASTISSVSNQTLANTCKVKWYPKSASFRYKLKFSLGDWSYTTGVIYPNQTTLYTYDGYVIPLTVANQITDDTEGIMTVTLYTYSNSAATTLVGSDSETFTVTVPNNSSTKPTVKFALNPISTILESPFSSLYIQGKSKVKAMISSATGKYGATIKSYSMTVLGKSYSSPYQSDYLDSPGIKTVAIKVTDSRGYYTEVEEDITVIPYNEPKILPASGKTAIVCARCDSAGTITEDGEHLRIIAKRSYSTVTSDGVQNNFCNIRYRYRLESAKTFSDWITLLSGDDTDADTVDSGAISGVVTSTTDAYVIQVGVIDDVGGADAYQAGIPTAFTTVDIPKAYKGKSIGIFRYAAEPTDGENRIDIDGFVHGGGIDTLTLGTMLTATAEAPIALDDILTPGCYYSPNAANSTYIIDSPYKDGGFGLEVRELQHEDYKRQTMYYGRTTIWRHYNGSEWSDWVRVMVSTEFDSACTDFVIEQGVSGGWTYKKWKGGTYEMHGTFAVTPGSSTLHESLYRSDSMAITPPFDITSAYVSGTAVGYYWITNAGISGSGNVIIRIVSDSELDTNSSIEVRLHVVGTYS